MSLILESNDIASLGYLNHAATMQLHLQHNLSE